MYFLFATALTASFLLLAEVTAVCFSLTLLLTALYLKLFSVYFLSGRKKRCPPKHRSAAVFLPLVLLSLSVHIAFFLIELQKSYIKDISIWLLAAMIILLCGIMSFGTRSSTGITAITNMSVPVFFTLLLIAAVNLLSGEVTHNPVVGNNVYQYYITVLSPPSAALAVTYMHPCRFAKLYPAFVSAVAVSASFFLIDSPFFKAVAINLVAPFIIASEMLVIKETILPSAETAAKKSGKKPVINSTLTE